MERIVLRMTLLLLLLFTAAPLLAAEEENDPQAAEKQAIEETVQSYLQAFAAGDAKKAAEHWTEGGEFFGASGQHIKGREAIEKEYASYFGLHSGEKLVPKRTSIRFIRPDVVLINGIAKLSPAPQGPPSKCTYSLLLVKEDGRWLMDHARETITFAPSNYDKLSELGWLVGDWTYSDESPHMRSAEVVYKWSDNKNFLIRTHVIRAARGDVISGTQRIGWDPVAHVVRSWMFSHDGGFDSGVWSKDGDRWVMRSEGFLRDGKKTSAVNIITPVDENTFTFESIERTLDGRPEPDLGPIEITRKQAKKK